jgi:hypothetical protein
MIANYQPDDDFQYFLEKFGNPTSSKPVSEEKLKEFRGKLPDKLLEYWEAYGFCSFKDGLFSIVDPDEYEPALEAWFGNTKIVEEDAYYVIARTAFGALFLWGEKTGQKYELMNPFYGWLYQSNGDEKKISVGKANKAISRWFAIGHPEEMDMASEGQKKTFALAVKKLGPLAPNEMFTFVPAPAMGGAVDLKYLKKADCVMQLDLLSQMGEHYLLDIKSLTKATSGRDLTPDLRKMGIDV